MAVHLRDGSEVKGTFVGGGSEAVRVEVAGQTLTLPVQSIDSIQFEESKGATTSVIPPAAKTTPSLPTPSLPVAAPPIELPAAAEVLVRLIDPADSAQDSVNKLYRASVDQPVTGASGQVVVPRGADAQVQLIAETQSGKLAGKTQLRLVLHSLVVDHHTYDIVSTAIDKASSSRTGRSAKMIGGLAGAGAVIGALAGGGKGAAIGAGSGAGLGTLG